MSLTESERYHEIKDGETGPILEYLQKIARTEEEISLEFTGGQNHPTIREILTTLVGIGVITSITTEKCKSYSMPHLS